MVALRSLLAGIALVAASVVSALTPAEVQTSLDQLSSKAQTLQQSAGSINIVNAPLILVGQGPYPVIIAGFGDITSSATTLASQLNASPPLGPGTTADDVYIAFAGYVRAQQILLFILFNKATIAVQVPAVGQPVANALRPAQAAVDTLVAALKTYAPSRAGDFTANGVSLHGTFDNVITTYAGIL